MGAGGRREAGSPAGELQGLSLAHMPLPALTWSIYGSWADNYLLPGGQLPGGQLPFTVKLLLWSLCIESAGGLSVGPWGLVVE